MTEQARKASDILIEHWQNGTTLQTLPEELRPADTADGYKIQEHILRLTKAPLFGWKIAATSAAGQQHINVSRPLAGRILRERVTQVKDAVPLGPNRMQVAELEFVFRMGKTLQPRAIPYQTEEVMEAVDGMFLGVEVPDSRYEDFTKVGAASLIADNGERLSFTAEDMDC
jgi:2-keto-4-pentenoate hydratase